MYEVKFGLSMVKFGQNVEMKNASRIANVRFTPPSDARLEVEAMAIKDLRKRAPEAHFEQLQRADFYRLIGVLKGSTSPMVDFAHFTAQAGDWLLVRPGQVFRYDFSRAWSGWLLVFRPDSLATAGRNRASEEFDLLRRVEDLPCKHVLHREQHGWMLRSLQQIELDGKLTQDVPLRNELLRLALAGALLRLSLWQSPDPDSSASRGGGYGNYRRFRQLLEADFSRWHQVQYYANALGMSEKTLSRVCMAAAGVPAKTLINQRLVLEAKRMLAHTTMAVQTIGNELGFEEPTNFVKFFRKTAGVTPLGFRVATATP
jgi:AraC-like DNA-binding protein